jgi:hypothetical protein
MTDVGRIGNRLMVYIRIRDDRRRRQILDCNVVRQYRVPFHQIQHPVGSKERLTQSRAFRRLQVMFALASRVVEFLVDLRNFTAQSAFWLGYN